MKINYNGLFTLILSGIGFSVFAAALPNNPDIILGYFVLIPFIMMGIFVVLVDIRNIAAKQLRYWEIIASDIKTKKVRKK
jgi:hypothetical protein